MADLKLTDDWPTGIYQLEEADPVLGGPDGIDNRQAKELGARTNYLRKQGIAPWDKSIAYEADCYVKHGTRAWRSRRATKDMEPGKSPDDWEELSLTLGPLDARFHPKDGPLNWEKLRGTPSTLGGYGIKETPWVEAVAALKDEVQTYKWDWARITGTPTTLAGYGIKDADFAKKAGDAAQTFQVADATDDAHALNRKSANGLYAKKGEAGASDWGGVAGKPTTLDGYGIRGEADGRYLPRDAESRFALKDAMAITRLQTSNVTSSVSSIDFSNLSDDYAQYIVEICDLSTDTMGAELWLRLSEGGGWRSSSYISTWAYNNQARTGAAPGNAGDSHIQILNGMHTGGGLGVAGRIVLYSPHSGSAFKRLTWDMQNNNADSGTGTVARYYGAGALESQQSIDGIRLQLSSGYITRATVKLYGVN